MECARARADPHRLSRRAKAPSAASAANWRKAKHGSTTLRCAQQRNLAAQIANPADLLGPRTVDPADAERRAVVFDKYRQGRPTGAEKGTDERVQVKGAN